MCLLAGLLLGTVLVESVEQSADDPSVQAEVVRPPADVVQEVLRLQEELGGSVVREHFDRETEMPGNLEPASRVRASKRVRVLREAAHDLEKAAHELESFDLYQQADRVREIAGQLRALARVLRRQQLIDRRAPGH